MGIGFRIKEARERKGLTQTELGSLVGVTGSAITNYEKETSHPKEQIIYKLMECLDVDANYLFQDVMKIPKKNDNLSLEEYEHIEKYRVLDQHGKETVSYILDREFERVNAIKERDNHIKELESRSVTVIEFQPKQTDAHLFEYYRSASAGDGIFILGNEASAKIAISESDWNPRADFVISISGDSMLPDYCDGDKVLVSQHVEMRYGDIGIFIVNGSAYIKEYGKTELISRNPDFPNIKIAEYDNIVCMGKVIGKIQGKYKIIED